MRLVSALERIHTEHERKQVAFKHGSRTIRWFTIFKEGQRTILTQDNNYRIKTVEFQGRGLELDRKEGWRLRGWEWSEEVVELSVRLHHVTPRSEVICKTYYKQKTNHDMCGLYLYCVHSKAL